MSTALISAVSLPRWKAVGEPYLLTRDELIEELANRQVRVTERQVRSWQSYGLIPKPIRRKPQGADDALPRALYPVWVVSLVADILGRIRNGATIDALKQLAPGLIHQWEQRGHLWLFHENNELKDNIPAMQLFDNVQLAVHAFQKQFLETRNHSIKETWLEFFLDDGSRYRFGIEPWSPEEKTED